MTHSSPGPSNITAGTVRLPSFSPYIPADETFCPIEPERRTRTRSTWRSREPLSNVTYEPEKPPEITPQMLANAAMPSPGPFIPANVPFSPAESSKSPPNQLPLTSCIRRSSTSIMTTPYHRFSPLNVSPSPVAAIPSGLVLPINDLSCSSAPDFDMSITLDNEATVYSPSHLPRQPTPSLDLSAILPDLQAAGLTIVPIDTTRSRTRVRSDGLSMEDRVIKALEFFEHRGGSGRMLEEIFDPGAGSKLRNAASGFYRSAHFCRVLDVWWDDDAAHSIFNEWMMPKAVDLVKRVVEKEMTALSTKYLFRMQDVTPEYLLKFELDSCIRPLITSTAPVTYSILYRALQSDRAARENKLKTPDTIAPVIMSQIISHFSQNANLFAIPFGLCQWAAGVPRQTIDTCAKIGLSVDYTSLNKAQVAVSLRCMELACEAAREHHSFTYDNMQVLFTEHVEQRPDAPPKVLTGMAMTIYPLRGASDEACLLKPIIERRNTLEEITFRTHVRPTVPILQCIEAHQDIHIVEILLKYSEEFAPLASRYSSAPALKHAAQRPPPVGYKTTQFPLRATTIAENTVRGNIEVWREAYEEQLKMDPAQDLAKFAIPSINDQATNAHIRSAQARRKHDVTSFARLDNAQLAPGMFHVLLNTAWYLLNWHRGDAHDLGSIQSFIMLLQKKRHGSDKPDYHSLKATEMQILDGLVLHAWELECGFASLADFAASEPTPEAPKIGCRA